MPKSLILASNSPRRRELLERIGLTVRVMPANVAEERAPGESPECYVKRVARDKVLAVVERVRTSVGPGVRPARPSLRGDADEARFVVGADTVVVLGERIFEKPADRAQALDMLQALCGRAHEVITGFCVFDMQKNKEGLQAVTTEVRFKSASARELEVYLNSGESMDKAGAYAIQGVGAYLVESLRGSYTNVVGLPLCQLVEMLAEMGASEVLPF